MENYSEKLKYISLSPNTAENIAGGLKKQVLEQITHFRKFVLWLDEGTDATNMSQVQDFQQ